MVESERRPQAGPLPAKRGEIGFVEGLHENVQHEAGTNEIANMPARHPADRDSPPSLPAPAVGSLNPPPTPSSNVDSPPSPSSIMKTRKSVSFGGLQLSTILIFIAQLMVLSGSIVAWVFTTKFVKKASSDGSGPFPGGSSASVFVHIVFVIAVLGQLVFLERRLFRLRGERYSYIHPGEVLPRHRNVARTPATAIAFAPWNRPPLPTYAATLAQSGVGTGDVEDHLIAAPPPPAYGNTRGSTLLLSGYLRNSLRAQRPLSASSQAPPTAQLQTPGERPLSYASRDDQWEEIQNAERARRLEETLSRLEAPQPSSTPRT
ncbi:hypothetical protein CPC08DRAFT_633926 [Agrocybe pediades]|nr:hypothetical protein CPC08DRAFT_633926 [Agrocybe pediades]